MHTVSTKLERQDGGMGYHYFTIPQAVADDLLAHGHKRILITLAGVVYRRALISMKEAESWVVMLGQDVLKSHHINKGASVTFYLETDPNPDDLGIPEELEIWLDQDEDAARIWNGFTPGLRRSLCYYVTSAKRAETRFKRTEELIRKIKSGGLYTQRQNKQK